jgi:hypothetical protein
MRVRTGAYFAFIGVPQETVNALYGTAIGSEEAMQKWCASEHTHHAHTNPQRRQKVMRKQTAEHGHRHAAGRPVVVSHR